MLDVLKPPSSPFEKPTLLHRFVSSPIRLLAQIIYTLQIRLRGKAGHKSSTDRPIRILCISDTHCHEPETLPEADVLIHAGDLTNEGTVAEIQKQVDWLLTLKYPHTIVIGGNHDSFFDPRSRRSEDESKRVNWRNGDKSVHYLQHSGLSLTFPFAADRPLKVYGAPQIPACGGSDFAFQYDRSKDAWTETIPDDIDILVTHTPPRHHLDLPHGMGCQYLTNEVWRIRPRLHVFGHVHCGYGDQEISFSRAQKVYESLCQRPESGIFWDLVDVRAWFAVAQLLTYGWLEILWHRVWGGDEGRTTLVNSALVVGSTGMLGNKPQVVEI